jgi:perosamine synthetase
VIPLFTPKFSERDAEVVAACVRGGTVGPGEKVRAVESRLERMLDRQVVLVNSGSVALWCVALTCGFWSRAVAVLPGAGFTIPTWEATSRVFSRCVMSEVDEDYAYMRPANLAGGGRQIAFSVWHSGLAPPPDWFDEADENFVLVVEDAATCLGRVVPKELGIYSFSVPKIVTAGQGGAVVTGSDDAAQTVRGLIDHGGGWREDGLHRSFGSNHRMTDMQAALLDRQLDELDERWGYRERQFEAWRDSGLSIYDPDPAQSPFHTIVYCDHAADLVAVLKERGVVARRAHAPLVEQPIIQGRLGEAKIYMRNAHRFWHRAVYLPYGPGLSLEDNARVVEEVGRCLASPS